jgi:hypothetical protein
VKTVQTRVFDKGDVALEVRNTCSLRPLQDAAHYGYLMENTAENDGEAAFEVIKFGPGIDEDLKIRLLHGYWSLMRTCLRLPSTPPIDLTRCRTIGLAEWYRSYTIPFDASSPDLLGLLEKIRQSLDAWGGEHLPQEMSHVMLGVLLAQDIQQVRDNIMDHFEYRC